MTRSTGEGKAAAAPSLAELFRVYLRISLVGFGGPNAHLALMLDEVMERRGWITREHFMHLIAVTNLLPGPNSSEVAIHVGYVRRGWAGAIVGVTVGLLPSAVPDGAALLAFAAALVALAAFGLASGWVVLGGLAVGLARVALV